jgi:hypothetical protein
MIHHRLPILLVAAAALLFAGCNPAAKAVGKWEVDKTKALAQLPAGGDNPLAAMMSNMASLIKAELEFKADGTWTSEVGIMAASKSESGTWRYVKTENDTLVLAAKRGGVAESEFKLKFIDDDHVEVSGLAGGQSLPLVRKKEP